MAYPSLSFGNFTLFLNTCHTWMFSTYKYIVIALLVPRDSCAINAVTMIVFTVNAYSNTINVHHYIYLYINIYTYSYIYQIS